MAAFDVLLEARDEGPVRVEHARDASDESADFVGGDGEALSLCLESQQGGSQQHVGGLIDDPVPSRFGVERRAQRLALALVDPIHQLQRIAGVVDAVIDLEHHTRRALGAAERAAAGSEHECEHEPFIVRVFQGQRR